MATQKIRNAVIELALRSSERTSIPERGPEVAAFVSGPLFEAAEQVLGQERAEAIQEGLQPVLAMIPNPISSVVPSGACPPESIEDVTSSGSWPAPAALPRVLVASASPSGIEKLGGSFAGTAEVEAVNDALEMLDELAERDSMLIVDCRSPSVSVETLLALAPELPRDSQIVLWGERHDLEASLASFGMSMPPAWVCCGPGASADDVAAVCRILI